MYFKGLGGGCLASGFHKKSLACGYVSYLFLHSGQSCIQMVSFRSFAVTALFYIDYIFLNNLSFKLV